MKRFVSFIFGIFLFCSCQKSNSEIIGARQWKHGEGFRLSDWMAFSDKKDHGYYISNDTIYENGIPKAFVGATTYSVDHYILTIYSLDKKQSGKYFDKGTAK